jgi:hypothetical protein
VPADGTRPPERETPPVAAPRRQTAQGTSRRLPSRLALPVLLALIASLVYTAAGLVHTRGEWTAPLDDAYIYYQYALTFAQGSPFAYQAGMPPTTGATSLLHLLLLVPWFVAGVRGASAVVVTFAGGALALAATLWLVRDLLERLESREVAIWGTLLFAASGPLTWGFFSGMELPLVHLAFVASCHALLTASSARRRVLCLSALALARPEGVLFPIALLAARGAFAMWRPRAPQAEPARAEEGEPALATPALPPARELLIPVLVGLVPYALALGLTGTISSQSMRAKALLFEGSTTSGELIARGAAYFASALKGLFGGAAAEPTGALSANRWQVAAFVPPLALPFFLVGLLTAGDREARLRRAGFYLPAAAWFFGALLLISTLLPYPSHWNRYEMPLLPLFLIGATLGVARAARWLGEARGGHALAHGLFAFFVLFSLAGWALLAVGFGRNARDIHFQHVTGARWIARNLPRDARLAVNDAGALAYFGERPLLDLLGLVSRGPTEPVNEGAGALYEYLEALPPGERPTHFAIYPDWLRLAESGVLGAPMHAAPLFQPSIAGSPLPLTIYPADWSLAQSGERPLTLPPGWNVIDRLDVADLESERAHAYRFRRPGPGYPESDVLALSYAGDGAPRVADGGRLLAGGERFRLATRAAGDLLLVARTDGPFVLDVRAGGAPIGRWSHAAAPGVWSEAGFAIPARAAASGAPEIELEVPAELGARSYRIFHYWVCSR